MDNIIDLAKWKQPNGRPACSRSRPRNGPYGAPAYEGSSYFPLRNGKSDNASSTASLWRDIRKTGTSLAEDFRVFAYAGTLSGNPGDLHRDIRSLRAAFDLCRSRIGREGTVRQKGFHVLLGNDEGSAWVNDDLLGSVLTLPANFTVAEAAMLIQQRLMLA